MLKKIQVLITLFDVLLVIYGLTTYAILPTLSGADFAFLGLFILAIGFYFAMGFSRWVKPDPGMEKYSLLFGLATGCMWAIELVSGNLGSPESVWTGLLYRGSTLFVLLLSIGAGVVGAQIRGKLGDGIQVGLLAGMLSALMTFAVGLSISYLFIGRLSTDPQTIREFLRSQDPTISIYIIKDTIGGMTSHLWIGVGMGLLCGAAGGLIATAIGFFKKPD